MEEYDYTPPPWGPDKDLAWVETCFSVQSMQFMIDCLPMIRELIMDWPAETPIRVLDVGTGTGAGANLLATLYAGTFLGPRMVVDTIDVGGEYLEKYVKKKFPLINYMVGDVSNLPLDNPWDLVICSHTIEHIEDYVNFTSILRRLARKWVLFYAPWNERNLSPEHINTIDKRFLQEVGAVRWEVIESPAWGMVFNKHRPQFPARNPIRQAIRQLSDRVKFLRRPSQDELYQCVIYVVPGSAS